MADGMKTGAGSDPFADDSEDDPSEAAKETEQETNSPPAEKASDKGGSEQNRSDQPDSTTDPHEEDLPYIFTRSGVKEDRKMVQYFLRAETEDLESDVKHSLEQDLGTDVYLTDVREALVRIGANHIDEVADELKEWGYQYKGGPD